VFRAISGGSPRRAAEGILHRRARLGSRAEQGDVLCLSGQSIRHGGLNSPAHRPSTTRLLAASEPWCHWSLRGKCAAAVSVLECAGGCPTSTPGGANACIFAAKAGADGKPRRRPRARDGQFAEMRISGCPTEAAASTVARQEYEKNPTPPVPTTCSGDRYDGKNTTRPESTVGRDK